MYQEDTEKMLKRIEEDLYEVRFDNKRLIHNPLRRNKNQVYESIEKLRKDIFLYKQYIKNIYCKYDYTNRGKRL